MSDAPGSQDPPPERGRLARWLFTAEGPESAANARRNAVFVTAAAGIYVFLIVGGLPPRDPWGYVQVVIAVLLLVAAARAWRAYQVIRRRPTPADEPPPPRNDVS